LRLEFNRYYDRSLDLIEREKGRTHIGEREHQVNSMRKHVPVHCYV